MTQSEEPLSEEVVTAWARLVRVGQAVVAEADATLKAAGYPPLAWYDALLELKRAGPAGLRPFQLQQEMLLAQYNLSRLVDRLVREGLVERAECADDRRGQVLTITPPGRALLADMWPAYRGVIARVFADRLEDAEIASLGTALGRLIERP